MISDLKLSELLVTRICHDLSGPVGAVNNGVELLKEGDGIIRERSIDLVEVSAQEAVARVLFFRQAFGLGHSHSEVNLDHLRTLAHNFFKHRKIKLDWPDKYIDPAVIQGVKSDSGKLLLNLILVVSNTLIHGGTIAIKLQVKKGICQLVVRGEGQGVKFDPEALLVLTQGGQDYEVNLKNVQAYVISRVVDAMGAEFKVSHGEDYVEMLVN